MQAKRGLHSMSLQKKQLLFLLIVFAYTSSFGQALDVGLRFQKTLDLYLENGVTVQYAHPKLWRSKLRVGISYVSSRLGSAIGSHAIRQDNLFFSGNYLFRNKKIFRPVTGISAGWFHADYGSDIFKMLPQSSPTIAAEAGIAFYFKSPLRLGASLGYHFITGDGVGVPGTLYPVYAQLNVTCNLFKSRQNE
jgi:hypothetical protein